MPVIEDKRSVNFQYINVPNSKIYGLLKVQETIFSKQPEDVQTNYELNSGKKIKLAANTGNIRGMYGGIEML